MLIYQLKFIGLPLGAIPKFYQNSEASLKLQIASELVRETNIIPGSVDYSTKIKCWAIDEPPARNYQDLSRTTSTKIDSEL